MVIVLAAGQHRPGDAIQFVCIVPLLSRISHRIWLLTTGKAL